MCRTFISRCCGISAKCESRDRVVFKSLVEVYPRYHIRGSRGPVPLRKFATSYFWHCACSRMSDGTAHSIVGCRHLHWIGVWSPIRSVEGECLGASARPWRTFLNSALIRRASQFRLENLPHNSFELRARPPNKEA